jgi:ribonuclease BN (tRNA processing enzyme)
MKVRERAEIKLTFLGTRGEIDVRSRRHRRHSALLVEHREARIMIDCGADWLGRLATIAPTAIVLTHAHSDHAAGLVDGAPCPVYATEVTFDLLRRYPIAERYGMSLRRTAVIGGLKFRAIPVQHSIRAPAVGYRISEDDAYFFYVPDVARFPNHANVLRRSKVYIGDGATLTRSMVRRKNGACIGHASVAAQLGWCAEAGVRRAIFTHCGSGIVRGNARFLDALVDRLGREHGIVASLACDGDRLSLPDVPSGGERWKVQHSANG